MGYNHYAYEDLQELDRLAAIQRVSDQGHEAKGHVEVLTLGVHFEGKGAVPSVHA